MLLSALMLVTMSLGSLVSVVHASMLRIYYQYLMEITYSYGPIKVYRYITDQLRHAAIHK